MEETTTGVIRLKAMEADGALAFPVIAVNDARTKHLFDNRYGTGQSHARRHHPRDERPARRQELRRRRLRLVRPRRRDAGARGMGAHVIVTEVDPLPRARGGDGRLRVMPMNEAAEVGDIFCTATGDNHVLARGAFRADEGRRDPLQLRPLQRRDRHPGAAELAVERASARQFVEEFTLADGRRIYLLAEGRLVNLSAAEGHPGDRDGHVVREPGARRPSTRCSTRPTLERSVYPVPREIDEEIARLKLATMGVAIDMLTEEQAKYLARGTKAPDPPAALVAIAKPLLEPRAVTRARA